MANETLRDAPPPQGRASDLDDPIPWDPHEYRAMVCHVCGRPRVFRRRRVHHSRHFMLSLGTLGAWLPIWGIIIIAHLFKKWSCIVCKSRQRQQHH